MKKIYMILFITICFSQLVKAQWTQVYYDSLFTGLTFRDCGFANKDTGWAVGGIEPTTSSKIMKTTDGGITWTSQTSPVTNALRSIYCLDANNCVACGFSGTIIKTTDGGSTWTSITSGTTQTLRSVTFTSATTGYIAGGAGTMLTTTDGGDTWASVSSGITTDLINVRFADANVGFATSSSSVFDNGVVYKTTDAGANWSSTYSNSQGVLGLAVVDENTIYAGGGNLNLAWPDGFDYIVKSTDGGSNWTEVYAGLIGNRTLRGAAFTSSENGWFVGDAGVLLGTTDGGTTWVNDSLSANGLLGIKMLDENLGFAVGNGGTILKFENTPPPPPTWTYVSTPFVAIVRGLYFIDENNGWAVGAGGVISKTTDGFATYTAQTSGVTTDLRSVYFLNADTGYISGASGVVLKTTDGGTTWTSSNSGIAVATCRAVSFPASNAGFVGSSAGVIYKSTDEGATWSSYQLDETTSDVIQLHMVDANTGYAVCSGGVAPFANGYVYKTTDGGTTWNQVYYNAATGLLGLAVVDASTVYAGGAGQFITGSTDGGTTWNDAAYTGFVGPAIRCGYAASAQNIFMGDDNSYMISTDDAGATWGDSVYASSAGWYAMHFPTSTVGYAGGGGGAIYKITLTCTPVGEISDITGSTSICNNTKYEYTISVVDGADSYDWTLPEGATIIAGEGTNDITVLFGENSGTVSVTASNGCSVSGTSSLDVTVNIAPATPTITFDSGVLTSSATSGNQWYYNGEIIPGATDQNYTATQNGSYYVVVTSAEDCSTQSGSYEVIGVGMGSVNSELPLSIYPNPMNQFTQINIFSSDASLVTITDVQGKLIMSIPVTSSQMVLSKNDLSAGMYMVQLLNSKNELISRTKLIVQ